MHDTDLWRRHAHKMQTSAGQACARSVCRYSSARPACVLTRCPGSFPCVGTTGPYGQPRTAPSSRPRNAPRLASCRRGVSLGTMPASNTRLAPDAAYCRMATRETAHSTAQGSGARQSKGGDRHRHQISARPYAHDSPPRGAVSFDSSTGRDILRATNLRQPLTAHSRETDEPSAR